MPSFGDGVVLHRQIRCAVQLFDERLRTAGAVDYYDLDRGILGIESIADIRGATAAARRTSAR